MVMVNDVVLTTLKIELSDEQVDAIAEVVANNILDILLGDERFKY